MATCPMCNADVVDDQMEQHKTDTHSDENKSGDDQQPAA